MKHSFKKLFSIIAAFMMVIGLGLTTVKAAGSASITLTNPDSEATYELWKIFGATTTTPDSDGKNGIAYYVLENYKQVVDESNVFETVGAAYEGKFEVKAVGTGSQIADYLKRLDDLTTIGASRITTEPTLDTQAGTLTWSGLEDGYYFIKSSLGDDVAVTLTSVRPNVEVQAKNTNAPEVPSDAKKVIDANGQVVSNPSVKVGDPVKFQISFTARNYETDAEGNAKEVTEYTIIDEPSNMTIEESTVAIKVGTEPVTDARISVVDGNMTITLPWTDEDGNFKYPSPSTVVITYEATLDSLEGKNSANVKFNETTKDITEVTVETTDYKITKTDDKSNELSGAVFELYADEALTKKVNVTKKSDGNYEVDPDGEDVIEAGEATIDGLKTNTKYYLKEIKAPAGYNLLTEAVEIETGNSETTNDSNVVNRKGGTLPETGGMGTTALYAIGGILVVGAAVVLIAKRRMEA